MADDILAKIAAASASGGGNWIQDGVYKFCIEKAFRKDGHEGTSFIVELKVIEASVHPNHPDVKPNAVGSTCSFVANVTKHASALGNIKAFVEAALGSFGYTSDMITPDVVGQAYMTDDLIGVMIEDTTYRKAIKNGANKGTPITLSKWRSIEQSPEQVAEQKAKLLAGEYNAKPGASRQAQSATTDQGQGFTQAQAPAPRPAGSSLLKRP